MDSLLIDRVVSAHWQSMSVTMLQRCFFLGKLQNYNNTFSNNNSEVLLGAIIHRPDAPLASQERKESNIRKVEGRIIYGRDASSVPA